MKKIRNEELNVLYCSYNIVRVIKIENNELGRACSAYGGGEVCTDFVGQLERKRRLGRQMRSQEDIHVLRWNFRKWTVRE
jgi:hypothetical protein